MSGADKKSRVNAHPPPLVSIVIPTKNAARFLQRCLESIQGQTYTPIEVIVVDNHSTDQTREIANAFGALVLSFGPERSAQVNHGVAKSHGKYLYRVDADFVLPSNLVREAVSVCETLRVDGALIHNTSDPSVGFWAKVRKFERDCYKKSSWNVAIRFMRRDVFEALGGFDETLVAAEDYDLHDRFLEAGYTLREIEASEIHIGESKSLLEICRKHFYYGQTLRSYIRKHPERSLVQLSPVRPGHLVQWRRFVSHPVLMGGFIIYQLARYFSAGLGLVTSLIAHRGYNNG